MKALYLLIPLLMVNACKTQTGSSIPTNNTDNTSMEEVVHKITGCPEEGTCEIVVNKNKKLVIKEDGIGATYPEIVAGENIVVVFTYSKKGPEGTADGDYSETIHFEIPAATTNLSKADASLSDVNLLFGRHCFCRDGGYFRVTDGKLLLEKTDKALVFDLEFSTDKTSQVVSHIAETVKL